MRQLGKALGIIARNHANQYLAHMDVDDYYAPSECHGLVAKGFRQRSFSVRTQAWLASGLSRTNFAHQLRNCSSAVDAAVDRILSTVSCD